MGAKPAFLLIAARMGWGSYSRPKLPSCPEQVPPGGTWLWARGLEGPPSPSCVTLPVDRLTPLEVRGESRRHPRRVEVGWPGPGHASPGQPARRRLPRLSRGPWTRPPPVSRRCPVLPELRRLLCTCAELVAVGQCRAVPEVAHRPGLEAGRAVQRAPVPTGKPPQPPERVARSWGPGPGWLPAGYRAGLPRLFAQVGGGREEWALQAWLPPWAQVQPARPTGCGRGRG